MFLSFASVSQAAFIVCSLPQADVVVNAQASSATFTCSAGGSGSSANLIGDGLIVTGIRLRVSGTFQENAAVEGQEYSVLYASVNNEYPVSPKVAVSDVVRSWGTLKPDALPLSNIAKHRKRASELMDKVNFDAGPTN